jgi:hypothetical protein
MAKGRGQAGPVDTDVVVIGPRRGQHIWRRLVCVAPRKACGTEWQQLLFAMLMRHSHENFSGVCQVMPVPHQMKLALEQARYSYPLDMSGLGAVQT